jgi:hypothetical protein
LSKLKPKTSDFYPVSIEGDLKSGVYKSIYQKVIEMNFGVSEEYDPTDRLFDMFTIRD